MSNKHIALATIAVLVFAAPAFAENPAAKDNAAVKTAHTVNDGAAREGANSFTEAQARAHISHSGYANVSPLNKDAKGIWRGTALKNGHTVQVGLDFKGNVVTSK